MENTASTVLVTPQTEVPKLALALNVPRLFLKREDLHPYGSHKGRSIPLMIDMKAAAGARDFVISSSGNAALAALRHIQKRNTEEGHARDLLSLSILVGKNIHPNKKERLLAEIRDEHVTLTESERPLKLLLEKIKGEKRESLRQSTDDSALIGYNSLAEELALIPDLHDVFIGTSSGTTAQALATYFFEHNLPIRVHIVQTTSISPLVDTVHKIKETSVADAITDKTAYRRHTILAALKKIDGHRFIATNEDIFTAQKLMREKADIETTANGALGIAGLLEAQKNNHTFTGTVVCIITGK